MVIDKIIDFFKSSPYKTAAFVTIGLLPMVLSVQPVVSRLLTPPASPVLLPASTPTPTPAPIKSQTAIEPVIQAKSAIVIDLDSDTVLYSRDPDVALMPASTTKIMTALVALETYPLEKVLTITEEDRTVGNTMNLVRGEQITVENLLYGLLVSSGNDAALTFAMAYPHQGYTGFVAAMNQMAKKYQLTNTTYKNVSGVETDGHVTSVRDLAILSKEALKNPTFKQMVATKKIIIKSVDGKNVHVLENTNQLLGTVNGVVGIKTGWTERAGECLVSATKRNGHTLIIAILGSPDRFTETKSLINWSFENYLWPETKL